MCRKIGVVILNYLNWKDTLECIDTLRNQWYQNFEAVVVDNASKNDSIIKISEYVKNDKNIHILKLKENLGFANGNNAGITFLRQRFGIEKILLVNNDVLFGDKDYLKKLSEVSYTKTVGAIGTQIIGSDGVNQNPAYFPISLRSTIKSLIINTLAFSKLWTFVKRRYLNNWARKSNNFSGPRFKGQKYFLHGSAIYLTENYFRKFNGLYGGTFLYYEEVILGVVFEKVGLDMLYIPDFSIYHKEDQSSLQSFNNDDLTRRKFLLKGILSSFKIYFSNSKNINKVVNKSINTGSSYES
ncbi:glycosyltransferase family 2 protein [Streptococcus alactolyticus]|uniref:glycosyltransferase family 2 protein n=1 Tax=Streptococcus alactolyticus TaxID=29389 RepID=UPI003D06AF1E